MDNPKVSIIIPVYNGGNFIEKGLNSVLAQTYKDFEVLIINDGSTDDSLSIIEKWIAKTAEVVHVQVFSIENSGVSSARNLGIEKSKGDYIAFLDCDDYWEPRKLETQISILEKEHEYVGSITNFFVVRTLHNGELRKFRLISHKNIASLRYGWFSLLGNGGLISSSLVYRKNLEFKFSSELSTAADLDFFLNLSSDGKIQLVDEPLVNYRVHGSQMHLSAEKLIHDYELLAQKLPNYDLPITERVVMGNAFAMSALLECSRGNFLKSLSSLRKSIRMNYTSLFSILISVIWKRARSKSKFISLKLNCFREKYL